MAWYVYDSKGVPLFKIADTKIAPDSGSTNPSVDRNPILAPKRHYHIYFMPGTTPNSVVTSMKQQGKNVALLPTVGSSSNVGIVGRSYWSFANDQLGDYDRFGYGGPTHTPYPVIRAFTTDEATGQMKPVANCAAQSLVPHKLWFNPSTTKPTITFENAPRPTDAQLKRLPHWLTSTGSMTGSFGREFPPSPKPSEVQFYRNKASTAPYADVQAAPPVGDPPDGCGGYVAANLPNKVVSLVHIAQVPSYPDYRGATSKTLNQSNKFQLKFYSVVIYGWTKQIDAYGSPNNSQIGNRQVIENSDGSATVVLWPQSATGDQVNQIAAIAKANHWNILRSGLQTTAAPNMLIIREKGPNPTWKTHSHRTARQRGAVCPDSRSLAVDA